MFASDVAVCTVCSFCRFVKIQSANCWRQPSVCCVAIRRNRLCNKTQNLDLDFYLQLSANELVLLTKLSDFHYFLIISVIYFWLIIFIFIHRKGSRTNSLTNLTKQQNRYVCIHIHVHMHMHMHTYIYAVCSPIWHNVFYQLSQWRSLSKIN